MASTRKKIRHGSNFLIMTVAVVIILIVINLFSYRHWLRWDLTDNNEYTISSTTRDMLRDLDNIVTVKVYLSKDLPASLQMVERELRDALSEFENYSNGKLRVSYPEPPTDQQEMQNLQIQGVAPQIVQYFTKDSIAQKAVYNSVLVQYEDKTEPIRNLIEEVSRGQAGLTTDFEYLLASKIARVQRSGKDTIGWITDPTDAQADQRYRAIREALTREWNVFPARLEPPQRIRDDLAMVVLASPGALTPEQLFEVDQFVMRGGKLLVLGETYARQERQQQGIDALTARPSPVADLLRHYGANIVEGVLIDRESAMAPTGRGLMQYPFWVSISRTNMSQDNRVTADLARLILPWTQPIEPATSKPATVTFTPLAWTTRFAKTRSGPQVPLNIAPIPPNQWTAGTTRTVIAALEGKFPSYFPKDTPMPGDGATTAPAAERTEEAKRLYESQPTQILVVGNALFIQDDFLGLGRIPFNQNKNGEFFLNSIEWLANAQGLGQIRARHAIARPIRSEIPDFERQAFKWIATAAMPAMVVVFGFVYTLFRRYRRRAVARRILSLEA